jgi:replicative DNA helicase
VSNQTASSGAYASGGWLSVPPSPTDEELANLLDTLSTLARFDSIDKFVTIPVVMAQLREAAKRLRNYGTQSAPLDPSIYDKLQQYVSAKTSKPRGVDVVSNPGNPVGQWVRNISNTPNSIPSGPIAVPLSYTAKPSDPSGR